MKNVIKFQDANAVEDAAALWLVRLDGGSLSAVQRQQLRVWLEQDARHRKVFEDLARVWGQLDALAVLAELFPISDRDQQLGRDFLSSPLNWLRQHIVGAAVSGVVSVAIVLAVVFLFQKPLEVQPRSDIEPVELVYQTGLGEQSEVALKDGSRMILNTDSVARVRYDSAQRAVYLERGEIHFVVAKNRAVPFVVYAGHGHVRAVGTAFTVRLEAHDVAVTVAEGTVEVVTNPGSDRGIGKPLTNIRLSERGVAKYDDVIEAYSYVEPEKLDQKLAWKKGKWFFKGETLAEVIAEVNRYTDNPIEIVDPSIAAVRVGGYFNVGEVEPLLSALEAGFGIRVLRSSDGAVQLSALNAPAASGR